MAIHGWGSPLWTSEIIAEFGDQGDRPLWITNYYRGGARVPNIGANGAISTSGAISHSMFYGAQHYVPPVTLDYATPGSYSYVVPAGMTLLQLWVQGAGGGGSGGGGDNYDNGVGGYPGNYSYYSIAVTQGDAIYLSIGTGGAGGIGVYAGSNSMSPYAWGAAGGASSVSIYRGATLIFSVGVAGGQTQYANALGNGSGYYYAGVSPYPSASDSGIQALLGVTTHGAPSSPYIADCGYYDIMGTWIDNPCYLCGNAGPGIYGGGGGLGLGPHGGCSSYGNGGNGGNGFIRLTCSG